MFAIPLRSDRVICRPDFGVVKVTDGSKVGPDSRLLALLQTLLWVLSVCRSLDICLSVCQDAVPAAL